MTFTVLGNPTAKGRPRLGKYGVHTPAKTVEYENLVRLSYIQEHGNKQLTGYLQAEIFAYYPIPKGASKRRRQAMLDCTELPNKKPDLDNIAKAILDSLNGVAYADDSAVVALICRKWYAEQPRVEVTLREVV